VKGLRAGLAGLSLTAAALAWTTGSWFQERFVYRLGPKPLVRIGLIVMVIGVAGFAFALGPGIPAGLGIAAWGVTGFGMGLAYTPLSFAALDRATPGQEGAAASALQLSDVLGIALGTGVAGAIVAFGEDASWLPRSALLGVFVMTIVVAAGGALLAGRLPAAEAHRTTEPAVAG
jgi:MFS family permease